jgi:hypothetical protein
MKAIARPSIGLPWMPIVLAAGLASASAGCGGPSKSDGSVAKVSPEFQEKTSKMLHQMEDDAMAKFKKAGARKPRPPS